MPIANPAVKATLVVVLAAGLIVGCQTTTDPYTGERKTTSTTLPALLGVVAGNHPDRGAGARAARPSWRSSAAFHQYTEAAGHDPGHAARRGRRRRDRDDFRPRRQAART